MLPNIQHLPGKHHEELYSDYNPVWSEKIIETWTPSDLWSIVLRIQRPIRCFVNQENYVKWFINSLWETMMGSDSLSVSMKDHHRCFSSMSCLSNYVFDLCGGSLIDLCHRSFEGSAVLAAAVVTNWISRIYCWMFDKDLSTWFVFFLFRYLRRSVIRPISNKLWQIWQYHRRTVSYSLIRPDMIQLKMV